MTTQLIGLKEFRQNISRYTQEAKTKNRRYIILKKNIPVLEVRPLNEKVFALEKLADEVASARAQIKQKNVYTQDEIMKEFGLL
ncbi:hypothetical protein HZA43_05575 [Candidatus Peregrinibacteria bacterium]|nr:hypothetical protein [Candidatus Peregrinibacteria bacterium]